MTPRAQANEQRKRSSAAGTHDPRPNRQRTRTQRRAAAIRDSKDVRPSD